MSASAQNTGLLLLLGLGGVDLAALNFWVLPALLLPAASVAHPREEQTAWLAASDRARLPPAASEPQAAFAAAEVPVKPAIVAPVTVEAAAAVPAARIPEEQRGAVVRFLKGTWWVRPEDRAQLAQLGAAVAPGDTIEIDGYADASGPDALNEQISGQRAEAIAEQLVRAGVDRARLRVRARGELPASASGDGEHDRRADLRVIRGQP